MEFQTIDYKSKTIYIVPFSACKTKEEMLQMLEALGELMRASEDKILTLIEADGVNISNDFMSRASELSRDVFQHKREKGAILGINGLKAVFLKAYNLFSKDKLVPFSTREEALEYLTK